MSLTFANNLTLWISGEGVYHKTVKKEIKSKLIDIALEVHGRVKCTRLAGSDLIAAFLCQMVDSMNGRSCLRASFYATNICKFSSLAPFSLSTLKLSCIFGPQQVLQVHRFWQFLSISIANGSWTWGPTYTWPCPQPPPWWFGRLTWCDPGVWWWRPEKWLHLRLFQWTLESIGDERWVGGICNCLFQL